MRWWTLDLWQRNLGVADRVPVGELGVGNVAHRGVRVFAAGTAVATPMAGSTAGLGARLQYRYHDLIPVSRV